MEGGKKKGIDKDQGVISDNGIVGIVRGASENYSSVLSVLHKDFKLNAEIVETGQIGTITWLGKNHKFVNLELPPTQIKFEKNKVYHVMTGPYSVIFPKGIKIGRFTYENVVENNNISINRINETLMIQNFINYMVTVVVI